MQLLSSDDLKKLECDMLKHFVDICNKHNFKYFIADGTLLGAIRHKGFIPWDDDIDIIMPQDDYLRFIDLFREQNENQRYLLHAPAIYKLPQTPEKYRLPYAKLANTEVVIDQDYYDESTNLFIDIFPLTGVPQSRFMCKILFIKNKLLSILLDLSRLNFSHVKGIKGKIKFLLSKIIKVFNSNCFANKLIKNSFKYDYDSSSQVANAVWGYTVRQIINKVDIFPTMKIEFEKNFFEAPVNYDRYLKNRYGDYMKLPPKEQQIAHGIVAWQKEIK